MEIIQIVGIALMAIFIIALLKQYRPEFTIHISLIAGILIFSLLVPKLSAIFELLNRFSEQLGVNIQFFGILMKITAIAYLAEFASSICHDAGETAIASKVELGAKIMMIAMSIPILGTVLESLLAILP